jgi:hypothetical protein
MPIPRRDPVVGCDSSSGDSALIGVGWLSSSNEGDGGDGGRVENRSSDAGRDFTAIRDEEREGGGDKDAIISALWVLEEWYFLPQLVEERCVKPPSLASDL